MSKSVKMQIKTILDKKLAIIIFSVLTVMVVINFFGNLVKYDGQPVDTLIDPMRMLMLSAADYDTASVKFIFLQFYPVLVILPAAFSYASDKTNRTDIYLITRFDKKNYYIGKFLAVFIVTFVVFSVPFIFEVILSMIGFPSGAHGNFESSGLYSEVYISSMEKIMFLGSFKVSSKFYALISILLFAIISGVLASFVLAISIYVNKYKVFLLFPVYILLYGLGALYSIIPGAQTHTSHFEYFSLFDSSQKNQTWFLLIVLMVFASSVVIMLRQTRKDTY